MNTQQELTTWEYRLKDNMLSGMERILAAQDKLDAKISKIEGHTTAAYGKMTGGVDRFATANNKMVDALSQKVPGLSNMLGTLTNPYVLAAAAAASLVAITVKAVQVTAEYKNEFLQLQNLNLDKTEGQIKKLNDDILNLSFDKGLDPTKVSKAFFDIQSATGKYGDEVTRIVDKVGMFSVATKTDMSTMISATAKGMSAFKLSADELDRFLTSSAKTVQMGITTFDELAKVQTEYSGSAAAIGQSFDTANKFFAGFTKISKSTEIAANLTKTAFQGLGDPKVQKGLKEWGINVFDANGKMQDAQQIVSDLNDKIALMSDKQFSQFMGDVGGPEGMRALLNMIKGSGDDLLATFKGFDDSKFSLDAALKNAKGDLTVMKTLLNNQIKAGMIMIGQVLIPPIVKGIQLVVDHMKGFKSWIDKSQESGSGLKAIFDAAVPIVKILFTVTTAASRIVWSIIGRMAEWANKSELVKDVAYGIKVAFEGVYKAFQFFADKLTWLYDHTLGPLLGKIEKVYNLITGKRKDESSERYNNATGYLESQGIDPGKFFAANQNERSGLEKLIKEGKVNEARMKLDALIQKSKSITDMTGGGTNTGITDNISGGFGSADSDIKKVTAGGSSVRNITVTINKLVENINNHVTTIQEGMSDAESIVVEALAKTVRNAEAIIST